MPERQIVTKVVVYDLPSENYRHIQNSPHFPKVRAVRVYCTYLLHSLGLECTQSVILVSPNRVDEVNETIERVKRKYEELRNETELDELIPHIEVLPLYQTQFNPLRRHAQRRVTERIDEAIERINRILESIDQITREAQRRQLRYRLNRLAKEWRTIYECCREIGVRLDRDIEYLVSLIEEGSRRLR